MSHYVPPHRKRDGDAAAAAATAAVRDGDTRSPAYQQAAWQALSRTITGIVNRVSGETVAQCATELFRENVVRGRGLLARALMRTQQADAELTHVLCALVARVNRELPHVVQLLCRRLVAQWRRAHARRDWRYVANANRFLCGLYVFEVVDVGVVYQLIVHHLARGPRSSDEDVDMAAGVFSETFRVLAQRERGAFYTHVLTPFRDLLANDGAQHVDGDATVYDDDDDDGVVDDDDDGGEKDKHGAMTAALSARAQAVLESCLKQVQQWEREKDAREVVAPQLCLFDLSQQTHHSLDLDAVYATEDQLDRYAYDAQYDEHEAQYETVRRAILGDDWEMQLLEQAAAAEEAASDDDDDNNNNKDEQHDGGSGGGAQDAAMAVTSSSSTSSPRAAGVSEEERQLRKVVYVAMRSSVRADEAVHKILLQMPPHSERLVCFMVLEGCCEERSFRKMYSMAAERLCRRGARYQVAFVEAFHARYRAAHELSVRQIEYTCRVFAHLLRTDAVYWSRCLGVLDVVHNDESQRLFLQWLLQTLVTEMGATAVLARLRGDSEVRSHTRRLLPLDADAATLEASVNLFVAMGVGALAAPLRAALEQQQQQQHASRKRPYDPGDDGHGNDSRRRHGDAAAARDDREYV